MPSGARGADAPGCVALVAQRLRAETAPRDVHAVRLGAVRHPRAAGGGERWCAFLAPASGWVGLFGEVAEERV
jgi:hypothetical protein